TVAGLDASLGVAAVGAHVPVPRGARRARNGIGTAHDANGQVPGAESGPLGGLDHLAQGFVAEDQAVLTGGRPPVPTVDDLHVRAADADRPSLDEDGPVARGWLRHVGELHRTLLPGDHGDGPHGLTVANEAAARTAGVLVIALASRTSAPGSLRW